MTIEYKQMDTVALLTTKNIIYLSSRPGESIQPGGNWSVAAAVGGQLLLTKASTVIRVPVSDVKLICAYNFVTLDKQLRGVIDGVSVGRRDGRGNIGGELEEEKEEGEEGISVSRSGT